MDSKREQILQAALKLFAQKGFQATTTKKIARTARVSEGLIFRYFQTKEGLFEAILGYGRKDLARIYARILPLNDYRKMLAAILFIPFSLSDEEQHTWQLFCSLKSQDSVYDEGLNKVLRNTLLEIFEALDYKNPALETEKALILLDGLTMAVMVRKPKVLRKAFKHILADYGLSAEFENLQSSVKKRS